jgi:acetyl-CoA carboxylase carboxyltransferase component
MDPPSLGTDLTLAPPTAVVGAMGARQGVRVVAPAAGRGRLVAALRALP